MAADLQAIITKIRRVTRSPSPNQIDDNEIQEYINTFILYDFPEELRLFTLRETFTWWCEPNIDKYTTDSTSASQQLADTGNGIPFDQGYITTHPPIYVAGFKMLFSQEREEFFNYWPFTNNITRAATGNGVATDFTGTLSAIPVIRNNVTFASIAANGDGLELHDDGAGNLIGPDAGGGANTINYVTGVFAISYNVAPGNNQIISAETVPYVASRPTSLLYYANTFFLRPIPDKPYPIIMEVYKRPTALLDINQNPQLEQWWQYIVYGASLKIFQDRSDFESVANIMPEFKRQEKLVLRRTSQQYANQRSQTMYVDQTNFNGGYGSFRSGFY